MSGHSKWANIQHRKGRQDAKRSNLWTKLVREIIVAARVGGSGDPDIDEKNNKCDSPGDMPAVAVINGFLCYGLVHVYDL